MNVAGLKVDQINLEKLTFGDNSFENSKSLAIECGLALLFLHSTSKAY